MIPVCSVPRKQWIVVYNGTTLARRSRSPLTDINSFNMTIISNDPSLSPTISYVRGISYFQGSCREKVVSFFRWCVFAVVAMTAVVYDWGAHDTIILILIEEIIHRVPTSPALTFGQEVCWSDHQSGHLTENHSIVRTDLGEQIYILANGLLDTHASVEATLVPHDFPIPQCA